VSVRIVSAEVGMSEAVERLRRGDLVAFPTETVYGLGANALEAKAVAKIFAAKGRPATNPLIVHIAERTEIARIATGLPPVAHALLEAFTPGPLTVVCYRTADVPDIVTAGGETVGVRIPAHPVAQELLRHVGIPIAAPSANRSEEISPTTAQHVADSLGGYVEDLLILDGGQCSVGIESTVIDVTVTPPQILRPGMVTAQDIARIIQEIPALTPAGETSHRFRSPGQMARHYAPKAELVLGRVENLMPQPGDVIVTHKGEASEWGIAHGVQVVVLPEEATLYAQRLYETLRAVDTPAVQRILVETPPQSPEWVAIHDRLRRAATPKADQSVDESARKRDGKE
jgi:L-threonylcarbamoyladenylate synthase